MATSFEPGRRIRRAAFILWLGGCLLLAAVLLAPRTARAGDAGGQLLPASRGVLDPGPRGGSPGAGGHLPGMSKPEIALFNEGAFRVSELEATCDTCSDVPPGTVIPPGSPPDTTNSAGLGGRFNSDQCLACHSHPAPGGTSPAINPSFAIASRKGATNKVPFFERRDGPTREVRFQFHDDGTRDGSVHQKFTVAGRSDAPNCKLAQPDFERAAEVNGLSFRIPTPLFGLGLVDAIPDQEILAHLASHPERKQRLGIHGTPNRATNNATIGRFGWKAQNASITVFAGEAYNVEMGITNELFPISKTEDETCNLGAEPNDVTRVDGDKFDDPLELMADWMMFSLFTRFLDAPQPADLTPAAQRGLGLFEEVGCSECHVPSMKTRPAPLGPLSPALQGKTVKLFSDLVLHHMGANLADNVIQGDAGPDMFRTAPLWGVGQRLFFLHDGRTDDLQSAIRAHFSLPTAAQGRDPAYQASEANQVVSDYFRLQPSQQQDVLEFLRSL
ncbi:MAG TPA: di-heme oxidoredictase family protein [Myxococcaceae bacterium]|nr:di-heme oxidoredictase family protein [Myxococcaceae bacterium]